MPSTLSLYTVTRRALISRGLLSPPPRLGVCISIPAPHAFIPRHNSRVCIHVWPRSHLRPRPPTTSIQVEYAIEAINNAGTCVGILAKDGIIMAAERKVVSKLLAPSKTSEKTYRCVREGEGSLRRLQAHLNVREGLSFAHLQTHREGGGVEGGT